MYIVKKQKIFPKQECLGEWCRVLLNVKFIDEEEDIQSILREPRTVDEFHKSDDIDEAIDRSIAKEYIRSKKVALLRIVK